MARKNFILTKKALASYLRIGRNTITEKLAKAKIDLADMDQVLDWLLFEGMGRGRLAEHFSRYLYRTRGKKCETCESPYFLQIAHVVARGELPEETFVAKNAKIECLFCHAIRDYSSRIGLDLKVFMVKNDTFPPTQEIFEEEMRKGMERVKNYTKSKKMKNDKQSCLNCA